MKVQVARDQIEKYGGQTERIAGKNPAFPILAGLRIEAAKNVLILRTTNLELGIEVEIEGKVEEDGVVVVSAGTFFQTLRSSGGKDVVTLETKGGSLSVSGSSGEAKLKTFTPEEFPTLPPLPNSSALTVKKEDLLKGLRSVWYSASTSLIKPELASVYVYEEGGNVVCVATDSFRLGEKMVPLKNKAVIPPFLIPSRNIPEIIRIFEQAPEEVSLRVTEHQLSVSFPGTYLTSRLVQGTFPDYRQIIPKTSATEAVLLREDFQNALKKMGIFSDKFNQIRFTIQPKKKKITLFAKNEEVGEVTESLDASLTGEDLEISFNMRYLVDVLQSVSGDSLSLSFSGFGKPLVIRSVSDNSFLYLVMPMNR